MALEVVSNDLGCACHLLQDSHNYKCDSTDLREDQEARDYWMPFLMETTLGKFRDQVSQFHPDDATAKDRAHQFFSAATSEINKLKDCPDEGQLTIRTVIDLMLAIMRRHGFIDPWRQQKQAENRRSLQEFKSRLSEIDAITDPDSKWTELVKGVLAGNMFDWGAKAVTEILEEDGNFGLQNAMNKISDSLWIFNGLPEWLARLRENRPHRCAAVFVDNSGCDIVLGVMPFVRELLMRKTKVILCANSEPTINDVTWTELKELIEACCKLCDNLAGAYASGQLLIYSNGQTGPCLDMKNLPTELCNVLRDHSTDLLVLEGMGRAVHTNLHTQFKCDTLKLANVKNPWLAHRLGGGKIFSVICKYEASRS